jgi:phospholipase/carboxylesterase
MSDRARGTVLVLHGRGGVAADLPQIVNAVPAGWRAVALQGPVPQQRRFEWFTVRDWSLPGPLSAEVAPAADHLLDWIEREAADAPVGVVGFSQGAATALHALRRAPGRIAFVAALAGFTTIDGERGDIDLTRVRPPVLWCRGDHDEVIPVDEVGRLRTFLAAHSTFEERIYPGVGHAVPSAMVADVARFLERQVNGFVRSERGG